MGDSRLDDDNHGEFEKDYVVYVWGAALIGLSLIAGVALAELDAWLHGPPVLPPFAWLFP